jgi:hypothetical protein
MLQITGQASVCLSEQTNGTKKIPLQIPSHQAAIFQAFFSGTTRVILFCTPPFSLGIHSTRVTCVSHCCPLCRGNCSRPIARTWSLSARLGCLMALFSSGWITYGSANFCSCSKSIQRQTLACSTTSVPIFQCWKKQGPTKTRSYFPFAYFVYFDYFDLFIDHSLAGSVSICNPLRTH